jgi:hypothetical protein
MGLSTVPHRTIAVFAAFPADSTGKLAISEISW